MYILLKRVFTLFCFIIFVYSIFYLSHKNVLAQVLSGNIKILDISIDSGGGALKSGDIQLKNTSIGQVASGNFITSGNNTVCAGHACKNDYNFGPGAQPTLQALIISAGEDAVSKGNYGITGLRDNQEGNNYYNSLSIQTQISGNAADIELAGAAFTENGNVISKGNLDPFQELLASADSSKGFVVIYANKNKNLIGGPQITPIRRLNCSFNFCANNYYVYLDGKWDGPFERSSDWLVESTNNDRLIQTFDKVINTSLHNPPTKPAFNVQFNKTLGDRTWGTYGFAITSTNLSGSFTNAEPISTSPTVPEIPASTLYIFELF